MYLTKDNITEWRLEAKGHYLNLSRSYGEWASLWNGLRNPDSISDEELFQECEGMTPFAAASFGFIIRY